MSKYDDILNHKRPELRHKRATAEGRAAQFGAFRALTGHEEAVAETARYTENEPELSENMVEILNEKLLSIQGMIETEPMVKITYFVPDEKKSGGKYVTKIGKVAKIKEYEKKIIFTDKTEIAINMITDIEEEKSK